MPLLGDVLQSSVLEVESKSGFKDFNGLQMPASSKTNFATDPKNDNCGNQERHGGLPVRWPARII
jgi:hypothetical protein